jgi:hypothetical protein
MRLEKASDKAMKFSCLNFHYAKRLPAPPRVGFSVFNDTGEWCGCVIFNNGIEGIQKPFGLKMGQVCELVRVALNGKQSETSRCVSLAVNIFRKQNPLVKVLVSYADSDYSHFGTIYQAMNWVYVGSKRTSDEYIDPKTGRSVHSRSHSSSGANVQFGTMRKVFKTAELIRKRKGLKHKYVYLLDKKAGLIIEAKPYPKSVQSIIGDALGNQSGEGGSIPT